MADLMKASLGIGKAHKEVIVWLTLVEIVACMQERNLSYQIPFICIIGSACNTLQRGQVKNAPIFLSVSSPWLQIWPRQIDFVISRLFHFQFRFCAVLLILFVYEFQLSIDQNRFHRQTNPNRPPPSCFINQLQISSAHTEPSTFKMPLSFSGHQGQVHSL